MGHILGLTELEDNTLLSALAFFDEHCEEGGGMVRQDKVMEVTERIREKWRKGVDDAEHQETIVVLTKFIHLTYKALMERFQEGDTDIKLSELLQLFVAMHSMIGEEPT